MGPEKAGARAGPLGRRLPRAWPMSHHMQSPLSDGMSWGMWHVPRMSHASSQAGRFAYRLARPGPPGPQWVGMRGFCTFLTMTSTDLVALEKSLERIREEMKNLSAPGGWLFMQAGRHGTIGCIGPLGVIGHVTGHRTLDTGQDIWHRTCQPHMTPRPCSMGHTSWPMGAPQAQPQKACWAGWHHDVLCRMFMQFWPWPCVIKLYFP